MRTYSSEHEDGRDLLLIVYIYVVEKGCEPMHICVLYGVRTLELLDVDATKSWFS